MAITLYCGRPGSGKSYGVVENAILPAIQTGRLIYTNIPLNIDELKADYPGCEQRIIQFANLDVTGQYLMDIPGGAVIVIDECWRWWPSGMKSNEMPMADKEFFAEHRHKAGADQLTQEIVLVTQSPSQIAKCLKDLIEKTILTVKAENIGLEKKYQVKIYSACIPSIDKPGEPNQTGFGTYRPEIYKYYKSHTKSETGLPGIEIKADKRGSIWSHWYIRYIAPVVIVGGLWGIWYTYHFFTGDAFNKKPPEQAEAPIVTPAAQAKPQPAQQQQQAPKATVESTRFRVVGTTYRQGFLHVYIEDGKTQQLIAFAADRCKMGGLNGPECEMEGQIVTRYTGVHQPKGKGRQALMDVVPDVTSEGG